MSSSKISDLSSAARRVIADVPVQHESWPPWVEALFSAHLGCIVLEVFEGLEDFVERELQVDLSRLCSPNFRTRTVRGCGHVLIETLEADPSGASVKAELKSATAVISALHLTFRLPAVRASYLLVHQEQLPQDLLASLRQEASQKGAKEARKQAHRKPLDKWTREAEEAPTPESPWTEHEDALLKEMERIWDRAVAAGTLDASLEAWTPLRRVADGADGGSPSATETGQSSFRLTFDRCHYSFPLLRNSDVQKEVSNLAWLWLNGPSWDEPKWPVSLENADLDITLKMIPSLWLPEKDRISSSDNNDDAGSLSKLKRNSNPPGSLVILFRLPDPPASMIPPHRKNLSVFNTLPNSTALLRYRAAALALAASLPAHTFSPSSIPNENGIKILEPCCGTGGLAVELAIAIARRRPLDGEGGAARPVEIYACDIDPRFAKRTDEVFRASGFPTRLTGPVEDVSDTPSVPLPRLKAVSLITGHLNASDPSQLVDFVQGIESVDLITTDLPWGFRVLSHRKLTTVYASLFSSFLHVLKPGAYVYLITAGSNVLLQALKEHMEEAAALAQTGSAVGEQQQQQPGRRYALRMVKLGLPSSSGRAASEEEEDIIPEGQEASGLREVVIGYTAFLCVLRKCELA
ncbi:unnamed protein product [Tilletia laevis]|uniref:Ribosomal RNA large subunit methyltransferase K/L-like methyltransferase domain-containing protein n=2 Tax=Tilletia TaxID=13289 RepID=A0A177V5C9_9BASI|nr:hypothetical protein CF336_g1698 [Tilletia laevis]KAE8264028.1 hypothetical protein A4X03_0g1250 [Tilletia caries]KAE8206280.1 hypothetical protein CF335_g2015 [Tilletia laevis]CAD6896750.1 unnamed protein product [Tilletia laevis]CAD6909709.1 unnamed protein product [Tilletia laevis]